MSTYSETDHPRTQSGQWTDKTSSLNDDSDLDNTNTNTSASASKPTVDTTRLDNLLNHKGRLPKASLDGLSEQTITVINGMRTERRKRFPYTPGNDFTKYIRTQQHLEPETIHLLTQDGDTRNLLAGNAHELTDTQLNELCEHMTGEGEALILLNNKNLSQQQWDIIDQHPYTLTIGRATQLRADNPSYPYANQIAKQYGTPNNGIMIPNTGTALLKRSDLTDEQRAHVQQVNDQWKQDREQYSK